VLDGDLIPGPGSDWSAPLRERLVRRSGNGDSAEASWGTQYGVYFSNLRPADVSSLHAALNEEARYTGYIDVTYGGPARDYFAHVLAPRLVVSDRTIVLNHGGDDPLVSNEDPVGFPFAENGYEIVSLIDSYFVAFMSYKIEARDAEQAWIDTTLNLAASTGALIDINTVEVVVPSDKLSKYLLRDEGKLRLMTSIGLENVDHVDMAKTVREKLGQGYIYDLRFASEGTPLFAVSAEFEKPVGGMARRLLALKYDAPERVISLVTMY